MSGVHCKAWKVSLTCLYKTMHTIYCIRPSRDIYPDRLLRDAGSEFHPFLFHLKYLKQNSSSQHTVLSIHFFSPCSNLYMTGCSKQRASSWTPQSKEWWYCSRYEIAIVAFAQFFKVIKLARCKGRTGARVATERKSPTSCAEDLKGAVYLVPLTKVAPATKQQLTLQIS